MNLAQFTLGVPVIRLETQISHATPRTPTAFERVLLRICDRFGRDVIYKNLPLIAVFEEILMVSDPAPIIGEIIEELFSIDVIRYTDKIKPIEELTLSDLEISDRGRSILSEDMLPAKPQANNEVFFYDPIRKKLLLEKDAPPYLDAEPTISLNSDVFSEELPEELINLKINSSVFTWWNRNSTIEKIEATNRSSLWYERQATLKVDQGRLMITLKDSELMAYVNSLSAEEIYHRFVEPVVFEGSSEHTDFSDLAAIDIEKIDEPSGEFLPVPKAIDEFLVQDRSLLIESSSPFFAVPEHASSRQAILLFDKQMEDEEIHIVWNEANDGCILRIGKPYPLENTLMASTEEILLGFKTDLKIGQESYQIPYAFRTDSKQKTLPVVAALEDISNLLRQPDSKDSKSIPALWESQEAFWKNSLEVIDNCARDLTEKLHLLLEAKESFVKFAGEVEQVIWDRVVTSAINSHFAREAQIIDYDELTEIIDVITRCKVGSEEHKVSIATVIRSQIRPPEDLEELSRLSRILNDAGPVWDIPFPSSIYTSKIMETILNGFSDSNLVDSLFGDNGFERALRKLFTIYSDIKSVIGDKGTDGFIAPFELAKSTDIEAIAGLVGSWGDQFNAFQNSYNKEIEPFLNNSVLAHVNEQIASIASWASKLTGRLDPKFKHVFVFDTSALLSIPDILSSVKPSEYIVVSKRVLEELDDKKLDNTLRPSVSKVISYLKGFSKEQIDFCDGDMSLLSADYRFKGDNLILSVAIKYMKHRPVLITNDRNLQLKASAEGIPTMTASEFQNR